MKRIETIIIAIAVFIFSVSCVQKKAPLSKEELKVEINSLLDGYYLNADKEEYDSCLLKVDEILVLCRKYSVRNDFTMDMKDSKLSTLMNLGRFDESLMQDEKFEYLGQASPGETPKLFNLGNYLENENNKKRSFNFAFSPDGKELFFSYYKSTPENPEPEYEIKTSKLINDKWTIPITASFSGTYWDVDINFSPDGKHIFFASDRPHPNSGGDDIYRAEWINGNFTHVRNLGPNINTSFGESNAVIAPNESYILFCSSRPDQGNLQKIYVSFQIDNNIWTKAIPLESKINEGSAGSPTISPDGKFLFYKKVNNYLNDAYQPGEQKYSGHRCESVYWGSHRQTPGSTYRSACQWNG